MKPKKIVIDLLKANTMKTKHFLRIATIIAIIVIGSSCSDEEIIIRQDGEKITLSVPAIQTLGDEAPQSRTVFDVEGTAPKVRWLTGDTIYIGRMESGTTNATPLRQLINEGRFTAFVCTSVDDKTNTATFEGTSIVGNSNIAVYTQIPDKVSTSQKGDYFGLQCKVNEVPICDDLSYLAKNDLLVSAFNMSDKKLKFGRVFGLVRFEFTLPEEVQGTGVFSCEQLKLMGRAYSQLTEDGYFKVDNKSEPNLSISGISVKGKSLRFYSLVPSINISANTTVTYTLEVGEKKYYATKTYNDKVSIAGNSAVIIKADMKEDPGLKYKSILELLNLDYPGLGEVKALYSNGDYQSAAESLLSYYRNRMGIEQPELDLDSYQITANDQQWADDALEHKFHAKDGYPSYDYDDSNGEIDWTYWPVKDNELRYQLHRHYWFVPMGKVYYRTKDEKYAKEWVFQYLDWIKKNPMSQKDGTAEERENYKYAWRQLETSHRIEDQILQFLLFNKSENFTPDFLMTFLWNYSRHCERIIDDYSKQGNHLLFEAQRMVYAGIFFPEFKRAKAWADSGADKLNAEIKNQVYDDGGQNELDPSYHLGAINTFCRALRMTSINNANNVFPSEYLSTIRNMIEFYTNICFPDMMHPCFGDTKLGSASAIKRNYNEWLDIFPDSDWMRYYATGGKEGTLLPYESHASKISGFFTFRSGWKQNDLVMVLKAGPPAWFHCQPDNATFELWFNGKRLFTDSGCYIYAGDEIVNAQREWFRQTQVHNTLTLDGKNIETTNSRTLLWQPEGSVQIFVTENQHYSNLKHRRTVFFVDKKYFVLVDEAIGNAIGTVNLNYHLCETPSDVNLVPENNIIYTNYNVNSNVKLQCFSEQVMTMNEKEGWQSVKYKEKTPRTSVSYDVKKTDSTPVRYITVIYPVTSVNEYPEINAKFTDEGYSEGKIGVEVAVGGMFKRLECVINSVAY